MREADSQSLYRAFIVLNNDEIITIRLSRHFVTKNSANRAFNNYGKPKIEYHLVISRYQQPVNSNKDVYYDMEISGVEIKVREYDLSEFNNGNIRSGILDEIIKLLTYVDCPPANNENKQYNNMSRKIVRLTESDLHSIVKEAVNRIINEESVNDGMENANNSNKILADILAGKIGKKDIEYLKQCGFKVYKCIFDGSYSVGIPENYVQPFKQAGRHVYRDIFDGTYDVELE